MRVSFGEMNETFYRILRLLNFPEEKAATCAAIFASNSRDGIYSHGLNRFPVFVDHVRKGFVNPAAEPVMEIENGMVEIWNGHRGPGMYNASRCMERAIGLAKEKSMACVVIRQNNHWMRGGTYGLMAAEKGCIGICFTNAIASMAPWGGKESRLGNNPLVVAIPHSDGPILLDMAMSQFSYGKMQEYELENKLLPVDGGYDESGKLTRDPSIIRKNKTALPIGFWKGSGLALILDILLTALGGGLSTAAITRSGSEVGLSQCFICIQPDNLHPSLVDEIIQYTRSAMPMEEGRPVQIPGERMRATRMRNEREGIPADEQIWNSVLNMLASGFEKK